MIAEGDSHDEEANLGGDAKKGPPEVLHDIRSAFQVRKTVWGSPIATFLAGIG